jgi:hypothetical protein
MFKKMIVRVIVDLAMNANDNGRRLRNGRRRRLLSRRRHSHQNRQ